MLFRRLSLLFGSLLAGSALAAPTRLGPVWSALYDAPYHLNEVQAIAVDAGSNVYVTGYSGTSFSPGVPPDPGQPLATGTTVKYSPTGQRLWVAHHMALTDGLALDGQGGLFVAGYGTEVAEDGLDFFTLKLDTTTGAQLWSRRYNTPHSLAGPFEHDAAQAVAVDAAGNPVVTGISTGAGQQSDIATVKYDGATGDELWAARYDGPASQRDAGLHVKIDGNGSVFVAGTSTGVDTLTDLITLKYDGASGDELWTARYDGPVHLNEAIAGLEVAADGSVFVAGTAQVTADDFNLVALRYAADDGEPLWESLLGAEDREETAAALSLSPQGALFLTGNTTRNTNTDLLTVRLDPINGAELWSRTYDGPGRESLFSIDFASALCTDANSNVYVTGAAVVSRSEDLLVLKYNAVGDRLWASTWDARKFPDYGVACALGGSGDLYVAGQASYERDLLGHGAFATLKFAPDGAGITPPRPDRSAPKVTLTETLRERLLSRRVGGQTVVEEVRSGTFNVSLDLPLTGVDPATFGPTTSFHLELGALQFTRTLGEDPRYRAGKTSAAFTVTGMNAQNRPVKVLTVTLNWARGRLKVIARSTASYPNALLAATFLNVETGLAAGTTGSLIQLGSFERELEFSYTGKVTTTLTRDEKYLLSAIQLRATGTPTLTAL